MAELTTPAPGVVTDAAIDERAVCVLINGVREALVVYASHHKRHHRSVMHDPDCDVCRMGVPLSRALPRKPDDREAIQARADALRADRGEAT